MANVFWQTVLRFDRTKIVPSVAVRNAIGIVLPLIAGAATGHASAGAVAALGAMNVSYSDSRDPYIARARRMLMASLLVGVAVSAGALSAYSGASAILVATLWAFAVGMLVVLGQKAGDLGAVTLMTLLVFAARSLTIPEALWSGLLSIGGGVLQTVLSIAAWPVKPHEPERRIVSELYKTLAKVAVEPVRPGSPPPASASFTGTEEALASLAGDHSIESERLIFLLNQAERIRLSLLTLRRLRRRIERDPAGHAASSALDRILTSTSSSLRLIGQYIPQARALGGLSDFDATTSEFHKHDWGTSTSMFQALIRDAAYQIDALAGRLRAAAGLVDQPEVRDNRIGQQHPFSRIGRLHANLTFQSTAFRHAIRMAVCVGIGDALGRYLSIERSYWLPMTVAIVLKPDFGSTFSRGIMRVGGTLGGLLAATALFHILPAGVATDIVLLAVFAFLLRWIGPANYGILVAAVSGIVVLLVAMTGVDPRGAIVARAVNTIAGGALALAAYWIWPTREKTQAGPALAEMLDAYRDWFHQVAGVYAGRSTAAIEAKRLPARLARSNAEASVVRFSSEPGAPPAQATLLEEMLVSSHAFVRAGMSIESSFYAGKGPGQNEAVLAFASEVEIALSALASALRTNSRPPDKLPALREAWNAMQLPPSLLYAETDLIATSLNTLHEQVAKWIKSR